METKLNKKSHFHNYIPNVAVVSFGNHPSTNLYELKPEYIANMRYMRIASMPFSNKNLLPEPEVYLNWLKKPDCVEDCKILKPNKFFRNNIHTILEFVKTADIIFIPVNTSDLDSLNYLNSFLEYTKNEQLMIFIIRIDALLQYSKLNSYMKPLNDTIADVRAVVISVDEIGFIRSFKDGVFAKKVRYTVQGINIIANQLIGSFFDISHNSRLFARIKAQTLKRNNEFPDYWHVGFGRSDDKENAYLKALIKALSNRIFKGGHFASEDFLIIVSGTQLKDSHLELTENLFKHFKSNAKVTMARVNDEFIFDSYITVTVFARNSSELKHNMGYEKISDWLKNITDTVTSYVHKDQFLETKEFMFNIDEQKNIWDQETMNSVHTMELAIENTYQINVENEEFSNKANEEFKKLSLGVVTHNKTIDKGNK